MPCTCVVAHAKKVLQHSLVSFTRLVLAAAIAAVQKAAISSRAKEGAHINVVGILRRVVEQL